jgi:sporulation protein YlmC with PRC-barrel domain
MKSQELIDKDVFVEGMRLGKIKGFMIDPEEWKVSHLEIELTKEASEQILGATPALTRSVHNTLAISALAKGQACCTSSGVDIKVSKAQLHMYLRPI